MKSATKQMLVTSIWLSFYHRNTPLPKVRTGLDGYKLRARGRRRQGKALCATLHGRMCIYTQDVARGLRVVKHANT
jgi:hypothetical protein